MATATQAIEKIAEATGQYTASVALLARHCRKKSDTRGALWPRSSQGGRSGAAHVTEFHVINLSIGMLATNTLAQAVEQVARYRTLIRRIGDPLLGPSPPISSMLSGGAPTSPADSIADDLFPGSTLGEALENLVQSIMDHEKRGPARRRRRSKPSFRTTPSPSPRIPATPTRKGQPIRIASGTGAITLAIGGSSRWVMPTASCTTLRAGPGRCSP
jgi:hypothetical protein